MIPASWDWPSIEAMFPLDGGPDRVAIEDFMREAAVRRLVRAVTVKVCHRYSVDCRRNGEDFEQMCWMLLYQILADPAARHSARRLREGLAHALFAKFSDRVKAETESAAWLGSRGLSTQVRRRRALATHAERLRNRWGREPSPAELVEDFNATVRASRKDAGRQGMIATVADLDRNHLIPLDSTPNLSTSADDGSYPLATAEAKPLVLATLRRVRAIGDADLAVVAQSWIGHLLDPDPYLGNLEEIQAETGLGEDAVLALLGQAIGVCRQVAAEEFGVAMSAPPLPELATA